MLPFFPLPRSYGVALLLWTCYPSRLHAPPPCIIRQDFLIRVEGRAWLGVGEVGRLPCYCPDFTSQQRYFLHVSRSRSDAQPSSTVTTFVHDLFRLFRLRSQCRRVTVMADIATVTAATTSITVTVITSTAAAIVTAASLPTASAAVTLARTLHRHLNHRYSTQYRQSPPHHHHSSSTRRLPQKPTHATDFCHPTLSLIYLTDRPLARRTSQPQSLLHHNPYPAILLSLSPTILLFSLPHFLLS